MRSACGQGPLRCPWAEVQRTLAYARSAEWRGAVARLWWQLWARGGHRQACGPPHSG